MLEKMECALQCGGVCVVVGASIGFLQVVFAAELQCAADADRSAVDTCTVVEREKVGYGIVGEGTSCAVDTDGAGVCRAVVLPEERGAGRGASRTIVNLATPTILPKV